MVWIGELRIAHVEEVRTSNRVELHIRGRVFRYAPGSKARRVLAVRSKERRRICVLDQRAASDLEHWNVQQLCYGPTCHHKHITRSAAQELVDKEELQWVGEGKNVATPTKLIHWENRGGAMQLLPGNSSKPGPKQYCQKLPQLSTNMGTSVAMHNDGRI